MREFAIAPNSPFAQLCAGDMYDAVVRDVKFAMPVGVETKESDAPAGFNSVETEDGNAVFCSAVRLSDKPAPGFVSVALWYAEYSRLYHMARVSEDHPF